MFAWVCDCVWVLASFGFLVLVLLGVVCLFICLGGFFWFLFFTKRIAALLRKLKYEIVTSICSGGVHRSPSLSSKFGQVTTC